MCRGVHVLYMASRVGGGGARLAGLEEDGESTAGSAAHGGGAHHDDDDEDDAYSESLPGGCRHPPAWIRRNAAAVVALHNGVMNLAALQCAYLHALLQLKAQPHTGCAV